MPRLILFAPCERVIIEQGANTLSMISILQDLSASIKAGTPPDPKAVAPQRWYALAMWRKEPSDDGKRFEQRTALIAPGGEPKIEAFSEFEMQKRTHRVIVQIDGFPVFPPGDYTLTAELREVGRKQWVPAGSFPVTVIHTQVVDPQLA